MAKTRRKFNGKFYNLTMISTDKSSVKRIAKGLRKRGFNVRIIGKPKQWMAYKRKK